jgi:hypothetical protein
MNIDESKAIIPAERIEVLIHLIRGQKVILDQDLAILYGVDTGSFNRSIQRNQNRFPEDFAFRLNENEWANLKCQIGIASSGWGGRRNLPVAFTEHGAAMAATILKSERAVMVSVEIVRTFIRLRHFLASQQEVNKELTELKSFVLKHSSQNDREFRRIWKAIE